MLHQVGPLLLNEFLLDIIFRYDLKRIVINDLQCGHFEIGNRRMVFPAHQFFYEHAPGYIEFFFGQFL